MSCSRSTGASLTALARELLLRVPCCEEMALATRNKTLREITEEDYEKCFAALTELYKSSGSRASL